MLSRRQSFFAILSAAMLGVLALTATPALAKSGGRVEGNLVMVDASISNVVVATRGGNQVVLYIPGSAKVERNGARASLSAFKLGDRVQARLGTDGTTVVKFEGVGP